MTTKTALNLTVEKRTITGRKVSSLRRQGLIPANIYGNNIDSLAISIKKDLFVNLFKTAGETNVVNLSIDGESKTRPVLISNLHLHPVTAEILHVDLRQIDLTKKVNAQVPLRLDGESPAEKEKGAVIVQLIDELEVEALPNEIPDAISIDISTLVDIGDQITVKDIILTGDVKINADTDTIIIQAQEQQKEEVETAPVAAETTPEPEAKTETKEEASE